MRYSVNLPQTAVNIKARNAVILCAILKSLALLNAAASLHLKKLQFGLHCSRI